MRKTITGCVTGVAAVFALAACSNSAAPAAAPSTTHRTTPPAAATAPGTTAPAAAGTTPSAASCTAQMAAWYTPAAENSQSSPIASWRNLWTYVIPPDAATLAAQHASAHALLGATLTGAEPRGGPPACNSVAATAWDNALTDLGDAATIMQRTTTLEPPTPAAAQDANDGFAQLGIVTAQGELAMTAAAATPTQAASPVTPAAVPSPSPTACFTPDVYGNAAYASSAVQAAGFHVVLVTKADPESSSYPAGLVWGGDPPLDETRAPCGSTVTLYVQP